MTGRSQKKGSAAVRRLAAFIRRDGDSEQTRRIVAAELDRRKKQQRDQTQT